MTLAEIERRIADIEAMRADDESAHSAEDDLRADVLRAIADGAADAAAMAKLALTTDRIEFARWCA